MEEQDLTRAPGLERAAAPAPSWVSRTLDPVVGILVLAGFFDAISGNPIHGLALGLAGVGLVLVPPASSQADPAASREGRAGRRARAWWWVALPVALAYGVVGGALERYTWPVTLAILVPGVVGIVAASRSRSRRPPAEPLHPAGVALWVAVLVALGVFELVNLLFQPTMLEGSFDHPTLSTLFDEVVVTHPRQSLALFLWLFVGWWLVER